MEEASIGARVLQTHLSMSSTPQRWKRDLREFFGKHSHLLVTWEGNNVRGLGDLKAAGPGEGRWQRGLASLGRAARN